jgi:outer membrane immunogenic protein
MRRLGGKAAGLISLIAIAAPAFAADMPVQRQRPQQTERAPAQQQSNWSGTQVGGFNGGSSVSNGFAEPGSNLFFSCIGVGSFGCVSPVTPVPDVETHFNFDKDRLSFTFGGFVGYRWQFGSFVAGVEGDAALKRGETTDSLTVISTAAYPSLGETAHRTEQFYGQSKQTWDASFRARLGMLVTPSVLVYGTGGVAFGEVSGSYTYSAVNNYFDGSGFLDLTHLAHASGAWNETRVGWTGGGGVEVALWGAWKARIEYRYTDLGTFTKTVPLTRTCADAGSGPATCATAPNTGSTAATIDLTSTFQTVRVGLGFDF